VYVVGGTYSLSADQVTVWTDKDKTTAHSQPIQFNSAGEAEVWFDGTVELRIEDSATAEVGTVIGVTSTGVDSATSASTASVLSNGSFEADSDNDGAPDNWALAPSASAVIATDVINVTDGLKSLKFDGGGSGGGTATSNKFAVTEGTEVNISWSFYATHATTLNTFVIEWYDEDDVSVGTATLTMPASGSVPTSWTTYLETVTAHASATQGEVVLTGISDGGSNLSEDAYFDGIAVINNPNLVSVDGTQTLTNKTLTSPLINGKDGHGLVILDTPVELAAGTAVTGTTTLDMSAVYNTAVTDGAVIAILKCYIETDRAWANIFVASTGNIAGDFTDMAARASSDSTSWGTNMNTIHVNLDGNSDFDYQTTEASSGNTAWKIHIIGYYV